MNVHIFSTVNVHVFDGMAHFVVCESLIKKCAITEHSR